MKVRQLRKVHQNSMFFRTWAPEGTLVRVFQDEVRKPEIQGTPATGKVTVVRARDREEVAVVDSMEEALALIEKNARQKKAKLVVLDDLDASLVA